MTSQKRPRPGDLVILTAIPRGLLDNLPKEDQEAISAVVGKQIRLNDYDDTGRAELEFTDNNGQIHFVYVTPDVISAAD